jgi:hypothetical protein
MKQLLFSHSIHQHGRIELRTFFLQPQHQSYHWDASLSLDIQMDIAIEVATAYLSHASPKEPHFVRLEFTSQMLKGGDRYYYLLVTFDLIGTLDTVVETVEVVMTLDYTIIAPEIQYFDTNEDYERYAILQRLNNQFGALDPNLKKQIQCLSMKQLWALDSAMGHFSSTTDLINWLNTRLMVATR